MKAKIKYQCPVCEREYDIQEEAENCYKPIQERFKEGDILDDFRYALRVTHKPNDNDFGISAEHVPEYDIAIGRTPKKGIDARGYYIGSYLCKAKKFDVKEAQKLVNDLKKKLKAAESFLEMVKACNIEGRNNNEGN